jgi:hypothetical protein
LWLVSPVLNYRTTKICVIPTEAKRSGGTPAFRFLLLFGFYRFHALTGLPMSRFWDMGFAFAVAIAVVFAVAVLVVIPEGDLLLSLSYQQSQHNNYKN